MQTLYEHSWFIQKIKEYIASGDPRDDAIIRAVKDREREGILAEFVREHGSEAVNMLFTQFNMEDALEVRYEEGFEDGVESGKEAGLKEGLAVGTQKGENRKLVQMVCRKLQKGKPPEIIAEELEEDGILIAKICSVAEQCGLNADIEKICESLEENQKRN